MMVVNTVIPTRMYKVDMVIYTPKVSEITYILKNDKMQGCSKLEDALQKETQESKTDDA